MEARKFLILFLFSVTAFLAGCSSLLYYPSRSQYVDVKKLNPPPEEPSVKIPSGIEVHGWYFRSRVQPPRAVVTFFHGNGQNRSAHFLTLYNLIQHGYDLAIFDYPGYGQTRGAPTPENTVETAVAVLRKIREKNLPIIVYGQSLGGAIAMRAVWELRDEIKPKLMVIDSSFLSYRSAARRVASHSAWTWAFQPLAWLLMNDEWAPGQRLKDLKEIPLIVIHSKKDEIIDFELGLRVFESASEPKEMWIKESGGHNQTYEGPEGEDLQKRLLDALSRK